MHIHLIFRTIKHIPHGVLYVSWFCPPTAPNRHFVSVAGMKFGLMVAKGTVSAVVRRFQILPGTTPISLEYVIALRSRTGMRVRLEAR
jgi:hypothetical protein